MKKICIIILLLISLNLFSQLVEEEWVNYFYGHPVSSGVYYSVIKEDGKTVASRKMLLMK